MRKLIFATLIWVVTGGIHAQTESVEEQSAGKTKAGTTHNQPTQSSGDFFEGFTRKITYDRMIPPYGLEVTYEKTVHIIFPSPIISVDLGSSNIIAAKAGSADNVLRVKSAVMGFETETNLSVITDEGSFYSFNIKYADEPEKLNVEMKDFLHDGEAVNRPHNALDIYLAELGNESPRLVYLINKSIYKANKRFIKHIGSSRFGIEYTLRGIFTQNGHLYLHTQIKNKSKVPFDIDFIRIKIVDKEVTKRTAIQETVLYPVRAFNQVTAIKGNSLERMVFTIDKVTIPDNKKIVFELYEKNGGRHQEFAIENEEIIRAREINELKIR